MLSSNTAIDMDIESINCPQECQFSMEDGVQNLLDEGSDIFSEDESSDSMEEAPFELDQKEKSPFEVNQKGKSPFELNQKEERIEKMEENGVAETVGEYEARQDEECPNELPANSTLATEANSPNFYESAEIRNENRLLQSESESSYNFINNPEEKDYEDCPKGVNIGYFYLIKSKIFSSFSSEQGKLIDAEISQVEEGISQKYLSRLQQLDENFQRKMQVGIKCKSFLLLCAEREFEAAKKQIDDEHDAGISRLKLRALKRLLEKNGNLKKQELKVAQEQDIHRNVIRCVPECADEVNDLNMIKRVNSYLNEALNGECIWEYKTLPIDEVVKQEKHKKHRKCLVAYEDLNDENSLNGTLNTKSTLTNISTLTTTRKPRTFQSQLFVDDRVSVKVSQGLLYFNSEKFEKGDIVNVMTKKNSQCHTGEIASISHSEVIMADFISFGLAGWMDQKSASM